MSKKFRKAGREPGNIHNTAGIEPVDGERQTPWFSFEYLENLKDLDKNEQSALLCKLHHISKMTWGMLRQCGRDAGTELIPAGQLKIRVPLAFADDETPAIVLHMRKNKAVIGFRHERVLNIVYVDSKFNAYNHG